MEKFQLPELGSAPGFSEYFWYNLPYALPGFFTFLIGIFLSLLCLVAAFKNKGDRKIFLLFSSGAFLNYSSLMLVLALRAVILDKQLLLSLQYWIYPLVTPLLASTSFKVYYFREKKDKLMYWSGIVSIFIVLYTWYEIFLRTAFTDQWFRYSFGNYPVGGTSLRIWGFSGMIVTMGGIYSYYKHLKETGSKKNYPYVLGMSAVYILILSNLPSLIGKAIYPGGNFIMIPMLFVAYGIFREDFLDLNDLLFKKNGMFFILSTILSVSLLLVSLGISFSLKPSELKFNPFTFIPLTSGVICFLLAIYISGSNPGEKISMFAAASLVISGFYMMDMTAMSLKLPPIYSRRIEQLCYIVFSLAPSIQLRFSYQVMQEKSPRYFKLIDLASILCIVIAQTPFLFKDYYSYSWGVMSEAGPGIQFFGVLGFISIFIALKAWWKKRKILKDRMQDLVVLSMVAGGVLMLFSLPSTMGIELYPLGSFQFIPGGLIAIAVLKYGVLPAKGEAIRITNRLSMLSVLFVPIALLFCYSLVKDTASGEVIIVYLSLIGAPLLLSLYMFTFILTRPIAKRLDLNYEHLEIQKENIEKSRAELSNLAVITKAINSSSSLEEIVVQLFNYMKESYGIDECKLYILNKYKTNLIYFRGTVNETYTPQIQEYFKNTNLQLNPSSGFLYSVFLSQKYRYIRKKPKKFFSEFEKNYFELLNIKSLLIVPILLKDEVVAMASFCKTGDNHKIEKEQIEGILRFSDQIAGAINNSILLKQVQQSKELAIAEKLAADKARIDAEAAKREAEYAKEKSDSLLLNILPARIAEELKQRNEVTPELYPSSTVMFTDFKGFTKVAEGMTPEELVKELDGCFTQFDEIIQRNNLEKLKTIGDSYMCAGGLPNTNYTHYIDICMAALEIQAFMMQLREIKEALGLPFWELRLGIHTGPVVAGVVGKHKFAFDVWGDTVNTASRMESGGEVSRINCSKETYELAKYFFEFEYRGKFEAKNKGKIDMYFLKGIRKDLCKDTEGRIPSDIFFKLYYQLKEGKRFKFRKEVR